MRLEYGMFHKTGRVVRASTTPRGRTLEVELDGGGKAKINLDEDELTLIVRGSRPPTPPKAL
jgi:hypothetical protein